jgi:hypothetical protein
MSTPVIIYCGLRCFLFLVVVCLSSPRVDRLANPELETYYFQPSSLVVDKTGKVREGKRIVVRRSDLHSIIFLNSPFYHSVEILGGSRTVR